MEVSNLSAHVTDGKFDTQGTVSMGGVTILDYITTGEQSIRDAHNRLSCHVHLKCVMFKPTYAP